MVRVTFDPETLTFEIHRPTGVSGCEVETWTIDPEDYTVEIRYCVGGEPRTYVREVDEGVIEELLLMARDADKSREAVLAVGILDPVRALNEFLDVRYVIRLNRDGKIQLDAVEILPCMGAPGCKWERIDGDTELERRFLDAVEELLNDTL